VVLQTLLHRQLAARGHNEDGVLAQHNDVLHRVCKGMLAGLAPGRVKILAPPRYVVTAHVLHLCVATTGWTKWVFVNTARTNLHALTFTASLTSTTQ
jgi:hypothetical protein